MPQCEVFNFLVLSVYCAAQKHCAPCKTLWASSWVDGLQWLAWWARLFAYDLRPCTGKSCVCLYAFMKHTWMYRRNFFNFPYGYTSHQSNSSIFFHADTANSKYSWPVSEEGDLWAQAGSTVKNGIKALQPERITLRRNIAEGNVLFWGWHPSKFVQIVQSRILSSRATSAVKQLITNAKASTSIYLSF